VQLSYTPKLKEVSNEHYSGRPQCFSCTKTIPEKVIYLGIIKYSFVGTAVGVVVTVLPLINVVNQHWARLVLGWVTVCGRVNHLGM